MSKRENYLTWEEYFMNLAKLSAMRSKDPNTQVGACIINNENRILSIGYNGAPIGFDDDLFPWDRVGKPLETKYLYVCHAELNAILNFSGNRSALQGARIYVTLFPCNECAKMIAQSGIKEVIYDSDKYADTESTIAAKKIFDMCDIVYRKLDLEKEVVVKEKVKI